jgi:adenosylcobinamide kinase / adenosylcobinamide-phosphate guanylyltransferase
MTRCATASPGTAWTVAATGPRSKHRSTCPPHLPLPPRTEVVLIDCATLWLTNHLLADHDLDRETAALVTALATCAAPVVMVTNEVGWGIVPDNALARQFRDANGRLNQRLAAEAGLVVTVIAGLPLVLKGQLP